MLVNLLPIWKKLKDSIHAFSLPFRGRKILDFHAFSQIRKYFICRTKYLLLLGKIFSFLRNQRFVCLRNAVMRKKIYRESLYDSSSGLTSLLVRLLLDWEAKTQTVEDLYRWLKCLDEQRRNPVLNTKYVGKLLSLIMELYVLVTWLEKYLALLFLSLTFVPRPCYSCQFLFKTGHDFTPITR